MSDDTKATQAHTGRVSARVGPKMVPLDDLRPHPLNSNVMPEDLRDKLAAHIRRTGRYPFLVVRPLPEEPNKYQVLDGHHRVEVLRELGFTEARCDVWEVNDREAKLLLATLNRLQGQDVPIRRARVDPRASRRDECQPTSPAFSPRPTSRSKNSTPSWSSRPRRSPRFSTPRPRKRRRCSPRVMSFVVTPEQEQVIEQAVELASDGTPGRDRKAKGLANLARDFLERRSDETITSQGA